MGKARDIASAAPAPAGVTSTELGYVDGVTSAIQTQINAKQAVVSGVNDTEIGYLDGVTSGIQAQLNARVPTSTITNKGDLIVGTGSGTFVAQAVGANGTVLTANSAQADGVEWVAVASTPNIQEVYFSSTNGSWTIPTGVTALEVLAVAGGGGSGGAADTTSTCSGGGGGAGFVWRRIGLSGDTTLAITVGAGGAAGAGGSGSLGNNGSNGSNSTIVGNQSSTVYASAVGGGGGGGANGTTRDGLSGASSGGGAGGASFGGGGGGAGSPASATTSGAFLATALNTTNLPTTWGVTGFPGGTVGSTQYGGMGISIWNYIFGAGGNGGNSTGTDTGPLWRAAYNIATGAYRASGTRNAAANTGNGAGGTQGWTSAGFSGSNGGSGFVVIRYWA